MLTVVSVGRTVPSSGRTDKSSEMSFMSLMSLNPSHHSSDNDTETRPQRTCLPRRGVRFCSPSVPVGALLGLLLILIPQTVIASQSFDKPPDGEYQRLRGQSLEIPCIVRDRQGECFWVKDGVGVSHIPQKYEFQRSPQNGDCSLKIFNLDNKHDEGLYQCQVLAVSLSQGPLNSGTARVTVLVTPNPPILSGVVSNTLRLQADRNQEVECSSSGGNPAPRIEWYINGQNVTEHSKSNVDNKTTDTSRVTSVLSHTFKRSHRNATIMCLSIHPIVSQNTTATIDVLYAPQVTIPQQSYTITEGANLNVPCIADANPTATITWKNTDGKAEPADYHSDYNTGVLRLNSISKKLNGAQFVCTARNDHGVSQEARISLDVLFEPTLLDSTKEEQVVELGQSIRLFCNYQGNPLPKIMWFHINPITDQVRTRETDPENPGVLLIENVTYHDEGHYYCELLNHNPITNEDKIVRSARMVVDVTGKPMVVQKPEYASGYRGTDTDVEQIFCSDPIPRLMYWTYGSFRIEVPHNSLPTVNNPPMNPNITKTLRHKARPLIPLDRHQVQVKCFRAILSITNTDISDEREYTFVVENSKGRIESVIALKVNSPISAAIMITIGLIVLIMLLALTLVTTLVIKRRKLAKEKADDESKAEARGIEQDFKS